MTKLKNIFQNNEVNIFIIYLKLCSIRYCNVFLLEVFNIKCKENNK